MDKQMIAKEKVTTFSYNAPEAQSVLLAGDFTNWQQSAIEFKKTKNGIWKATVTLAPGKYQYRLLVDGKWQDDPSCTERQPNQFGSANCIRVVDGL